MHEFDGKMWSEAINQNLFAIVTNAHMAGQRQRGLEPSYSDALNYFEAEQADNFAGD